MALERLSNYSIEDLSRVETMIRQFETSELAGMMRDYWKLISAPYEETADKTVDTTNMQGINRAKGFLDAQRYFNRTGFGLFDFVRELKGKMIEAQTIQAASGEVPIPQAK